jgi:hypothetical protein
MMKWLIAGPNDAALKEAILAVDSAPRSSLICQAAKQMVQPMDHRFTWIWGPTTNVILSVLS